jgi:hypothetical protein
MLMALLLSGFAVSRPVPPRAARGHTLAIDPLIIVGDVSQREVTTATHE